MTPAAICSRSGSGAEALPLPRKPRLTGNSSAASSMRWMFHSPGRARRRRGAGGRAGAAADQRGEPGADRLGHDLRTDEVDVAVEAARGDDLALAGDHLGGRRRSTMPGVTPAMRSGLPALPTATMRPSRMPMSAFTMPQWSMITALVMTVSSVASARVARADCPMPSRITLPPPNFASSPGGGEVALDADEQLGVGQPDAVADGGAVEVGVLPSRNPEGHCSELREAGLSRRWPDRGPRGFMSARSHWARSWRGPGRGRRPG